MRAIPKIRSHANSFPTSASSTGTPPSGGPDSVQGAAFRLAALQFHTLLVDRPAPLPERQPLALTSVHATMLQALRPAPAFVARHSDRISVAQQSFTKYIDGYHDKVPAPQEPRIARVMAYDRADRHDSVTALMEELAPYARVGESAPAPVAASSRPRSSPHAETIVAPVTSAAPRSHDAAGRSGLGRRKGGQARQ